MPNILQIPIGTRYGKLQVVKEVARTYYRARRFLLSCDCGNNTEVNLSHLRNGATVSCGCFKKEYKHGQSHSRIYATWAAMLQRCYNKNCEAYEDYGNRGIIVDQPWHEFKNFYTDMYETYNVNLSLDRIDNDKGYSKNNCKWSNQYEQSRNRQTSRYVELNGRRMNLQDAARIVGFDPHTLRNWFKKEKRVKVNDTTELYDLSS